MKKKISAYAFSILFFSSITFSGLAMATTQTEANRVIDKDKDKKAKKSKKQDCKNEKSCCDYDKAAKSCDDKDKGKDDK